jgi:hypothetical protein
MSTTPSAHIADRSSNTDTRGPGFRSSRRECARAVRMPRHNAGKAQRHIRIADRKHMGPGDHAGADHRDTQGFAT